MVIGTGSLSFDLVKALTDRLPVMLCPKWLSTATQPIAIDDALAYLLAAKELPLGASRILRSVSGYCHVWRYHPRICSPTRPSAMADFRARADALLVEPVGFALVTPASFEIGRHLIEGVGNSDSWQLIRRH